MGELDDRVLMKKVTVPVVPESLAADSALSSMLKGQKWDVPTTERELLRTFYRGKQDDVAQILMPNYNWLSTEKRAILSKYFTYVNLLKPAVNRLVSGVYGGRVVRTLEKDCPYREQVLASIDEKLGYSQKLRETFRAAVLYGDGIMAFTVVNDRVRVWRPNPLVTRIVTNPNDVTDLTAIVELLPTGDYRFASKRGWGYLNKAGNIYDYAEHSLGIVPAVVFYGESQLEYGEPYGDSLVECGLYYSAVLTQLRLNQVALMMNYVSPQAVASGEVKNDDPQEAFRGGLLEMGADGKFMFVTPQTNFKDLTETNDSYKTDFCISAGIPMDALDPSNIPENQSATSARLRNQPLSVTINRLVEETTHNELRCLTIVGALYQFIETGGKPVNFEQFSDLFRASVKIEANGAPVSFGEEVAAWTQLHTAGAKTTEEMIRHFGDDLSEEEIQRRVEESDKRRAAMAASLYDGNGGTARDGGNAKEPSRDGAADQDLKEENA